MTSYRRLPAEGGLLGKIYESHYRDFRARLPVAAQGLVLELGSGHGFVKQIIPTALTSELWEADDMDLRCSATLLPFADQSLSAILMLDVLHHVQHPERFFAEAERCLVPGGRIMMVEPASTAMSRLIYRHLHHETFDDRAEHWALPDGDPTLIANGAMPWIIFIRDRARFEALFPQLQIEAIEHCLPFSYLLSGGLSQPQFLPGVLYPYLARFEAHMPGWLLRATAMFYRVRVTKTALQDCERL